MNEIDNLTQCEKMLWIMYKEIDNNKEWYGKDFQRGNNFIGYEASARMSDLKRMYPSIFIEGKDGRYRTLRLNIEQKDYIEEILGIKRSNNND
jgi:uncharacterized alpha/beta hydrolase family protein